MKTHVIGAIALAIAGTAAAGGTVHSQAGTTGSLKGQARTHASVQGVGTSDSRAGGAGVLTVTPRTAERPHQGTADLTGYSWSITDGRGATGGALARGDANFSSSERTRSGSTEVTGAAHIYTESQPGQGQYSWAGTDSVANVRPAVGGGQISYDSYSWAGSAALTLGQTLLNPGIGYATSSGSANAQLRPRFDFNRRPGH